jgi:ribosomal protein S18 acetylase RimI-like enzyme
MNTEIKLLTNNDIDLMQEVLEDDNMVFDAESLSRFIDSDNCFGFIAKSDNKIVGFAYAYSLLRSDGKYMFYLHSIGILPNYQDKGIGTQLMEYVVSYAKSNNYSECFVITDKGNPRACHLYEKLGGKSEFKDEIVYVYDFEKPKA